jgi:hypothetical protein
MWATLDTNSVSRLGHGEAHRNTRNDIVQPGIPPGNLESDGVDGGDGRLQEHSYLDALGLVYHSVA